MPDYFKSESQNVIYKNSMKHRDGNINLDVCLGYNGALILFSSEVDSVFT